MYKKLMLAAVFVMMLAACGPKTTHLSAQFGDNVTDRVKVAVGDKIDTVVYLQNGKLEIDVPADVTSVSRVRAGMSVYTFISDGSQITLVPEDGKAHSDKKNGVHSRFVEYNSWLNSFIADYRKKADEIGDDKEAADAYFNEEQAKYNDYQRATLKANKGNILGVMALSHLNIDDPKEMLSLINSLSSKMKETPEAIALKKEYEAKVK